MTRGIEVDNQGRVYVGDLGNNQVQLFFDQAAVPTPVPTLSHWGLIIFGLTLLCIAAIALKNQALSFLAQGCQDYLEDVTGLIVGNMVDPQTGEFWYKPPPQNPYTWRNSGRNVRVFGLMANFKYEGQQKTAYSQVVIDPNRMSEGSHEVVAILFTAAIEGNRSNSILRFKSVQVGGEIIPNGSQQAGLSRDAFA